MSILSGPMSKSLKTTILVAGVLLLFPGLLLAMANLCLMPLAI